MATPLALIWDLIARDGASATFARVAASADKAAVATGRAEAGVMGFGKKAGAALAALATIDFAVHVIKDAAAFQKAMLLVQTQAGATAGEVKTLSAAVLGMAGSVGTAPEELATSLYHVYSVGLRGAAALDVVRIAAEGAKVGNADLEETTNALTAAVTSGIPGVGNMAQAMGMLNTIVGVGDMKLSDLNDAMSSGILVTAKQFGLSLTDVGAALAVFGDNNIRGANAATMLRVAITSMSDPVAKGRDELAKLGLTSKTLRDDMSKGGLDLAVSDLAAHLERAGIKGSQLGGVLTETFGKKAGPGISILVDQLTRLETKMDGIDKGGATFADRWAATQKTASFALDRIRASFEVVAISIGNKLLPDVTAIAHAIGTGIPEAAHAAMNVLAPFGAVWDGLVSVLGPIAGLIGAIAHALAPLAPAMEAVITTALALWAGFKLGALIPVIITAIGSALDTLALRAMYAGDTVAAGWAVMSTGAADAAIGTGFASAAIVTDADTAAAGVVASGDAARVGWAGLAGPLGAAALGVVAIISMFHRSSSASKEATEAAKAYSDALTKGNNVSLADTITDRLKSNNIPAILKQYNDGLDANAAKWRVSGTEMFNAIKENGPALAKLQTKIAEIAITGRGNSPAYKLLKSLKDEALGLDEATKKDLVDTKTFQGAAASIGSVSVATQVGTDTAKKYAEMVGIAVDKNGVAAVSAKTLEAATTAVSNAFAGATQTGDAFLQAVNTFSASAGTAADRATLIGATLKNANGDALNYAAQMNNAAVATATFHNDIATAAKTAKLSIHEYMASIVDLKTGTIKYNNAAAAPLIADLGSIQSSAMAAAQATYQHSLATMSGSDAADAAYNVYVSKTKGQFIDTEGHLTAQGQALHLTAAQAGKLADQYFGMPSDVKTLIEQEGGGDVTDILNRIGALLAKLIGVPWDVKVGATDDATPVIVGIQARIDNLHGKTLVIDVAYKVGDGLQLSGTGKQLKAAGGFISGPGTATSDSVPAMLSNGEYVINAGQTKKHRALLAAINTGRQGFATGGPVGGVDVGGIHYASLAAAGNAIVRAFRALATALPKFISALGKTVDQLKTAEDALTKDARAAGVSKSTLANISKDFAKINKLAAQRDALNAKLGTQSKADAQTAYDKLGVIVTAFKDEIHTVADAITSGFNILTAGQNTTGTPSPAYQQALARYNAGRVMPEDEAILAGGDGSDGGTSITAIMGSLTQQLAAAQKFRDELAKLKKEGLSDALYKQLAEAGVSGAGTTVDALATQATAGQIKQLSGDYKKLQDIAGATGKDVATETMGKQLKAAQDTVAALKAQTKALGAKIDHIGASVASALNTTAGRAALAGRTAPAGR